MARTNTAGQNIFTRPFPSAVVYDLSVPDEATIKLPPKSTWTSGPHWHETHTEFLQVISGCAEIMLSGKVMPSVGPRDGVITVPRGAIHEWRRSQTEGTEEEVVVKEWTEPRDGQKEAFFRNLNSVVLDAIGAGEGSWRMRTLELELMNIFWRLDNWPLFLPQAWPGWMQAVATKTWLTGAAALGWISGCQGVHREYTARS